MRIIYGKASNEARAIMGPQAQASVEPRTRTRRGDHHTGGDDAQRRSHGADHGVVDGVASNSRPRVDRIPVLNRDVPYCRSTCGCGGGQGHDADDIAAQGLLWWLVIAIAGFVTALALILT